MELLNFWYTKSRVIQTPKLTVLLEYLGIDVCSIRLNNWIVDKILYRNEALLCKTLGDNANSIRLMSSHTHKYGRMRACQDNGNWKMVCRTESHDSWIVE